MNKVALMLIAGCILLSCNRYNNKECYDLSVQERIEIYYSTNSCCYYCVSNENELRHIKVVDRKTVDPGPSDCAGCNYTAAFTFEGISLGTDTLELKHVTANTDCHSNDVLPERYIIKVK